jgi:hypothetical protein
VVREKFELAKETRQRQQARAQHKSKRTLTNRTVWNVIDATRLVRELNIELQENAIVMDMIRQWYSVSELFNLPACMIQTASVLA